MIYANKFDNFSITVPSNCGNGEQVVVFNVIGYDRGYLNITFKTEKIGSVIHRILTEVKSDKCKDIVKEIASRMWEAHIHVEYEYITEENFSFMD